jgi:hypothetical protein
MTRRQLEKRKFAATSKPRQAGPRRSQKPRHIPAHVKRAVQERDQGQCTFVSESGHRCSARRFLEFDHIEPVARGGQATLDNLRLRCRAHNQYEAECAFGTEFMKHKREVARQAADESIEAQAREVIPWLRRLGIRASEARDAAKLCTSMPNATLEERIRMALSHFSPRGTIRFGPVAPSRSADSMTSARPQS